MAASPSPVPDMFTNLMASAPRRTPTSPTAWLVSTGTHALVLLAAAWAAGRVATAPGARLDNVTYFEVTDPTLPPPEVPEAPPAEPVRPEPAPVHEVTRPDLPEGFQQLAAPTEILAEIPAPGQIEFKAADFTGQGIAGGVAGGRPLLVAAAAPRDTTPAFVPPPVSVAVVDEVPRVVNLRDVANRIRELYPPHLRMLDVEGRALVQLVIDTDGRVEREGISVVSATHEEFEGPSRAVALLLRFEPARRNGKPVRTWIRLPVDWTID